LHVPASDLVASNLLATENPLQYFRFQLNVNSRLVIAFLRRCNYDSPFNAYIRLKSFVSHRSLSVFEFDAGGENPQTFFIHLDLPTKAPCSASTARQKPYS
jgi:hypothetical protein